MNFTERVKSITQDYIAPKVTDNFLSDNVMTYRFLGNGRKWKGETYKIPVKIASNTQGKSIGINDTLNMGVANTRVRFSFDPRVYTIPVVIPGIERAVNAGSESQVLNLVETEMESTGLDMLDQVAQIFYLDGTGNTSNDFLGMIAHADNGTNVDTLGGLSRATYTTLKGQYLDFTSGLSLARMGTLVSGVASGSSRSERPSLFVSTESEWDLAEQLLTPTVRNNYEAFGFPRITRKSVAPVRGDAFTASGGFDAIVIRGIPWVADERATAANIWAINENYLFWAGITDPKLKQISIGGGKTHEGAASDAPTGNTGVQWTGLMDSLNQYAEVGHLFLLGNLIGNQPRRQGRAYNVTAL